ncbi:hypothetical protein ACWGH6_37285, partial [Streptomyces xanthophaeus]
MPPKSCCSPGREPAALLTVAPPAAAGGPVAGPVAGPAARRAARGLVDIAGGRYLRGTRPGP